MAQTFESPQVKSLLNYDPRVDLEKLNIPVFIIFGGKDTQVPADMNQPPIETALDSAGTIYMTKVFPNANHLFQEAKTGSIREYAALENEFVDGFIPVFSEWIKEATLD